MPFFPREIAQGMTSVINASQFSTCEPTRGVLCPGFRQVQDRHGHTETSPEEHQDGQRLVHTKYEERLRDGFV